MAAWVLVDPFRAASLHFGRPPTGVEQTVIVVLGIRQLLQALIVSATDARTISAGIDALHGASMLALLAAAPRRYGRAALLQTGSAFLLAALEARAASQQQSRRNFRSG